MSRKKYEWALPDSITKRLGSKTYGNQRIIFEENHLLIILRDLPSDPDDQKEHKIFLINSQLDVFCNGAPKGEDEMYKLLDSFQVELDTLEDELDDAKTIKQYFNVQEKLLPICRVIKSQAKTLQEARKAIKDDRFLLEVRDISAELNRGYEILLSDCRLELELLIAQKTEEQADKASDALEAQNKLNLLASFTFPIMAVSTIFGMNLPHGLEKEPSTLFWIVIIVGVGVGFGVKKWLFRKSE